MKIIRNQDVIEIGGDELLEILREAVRARHGRELDRITWVSETDHTQLGRPAGKLVHLNATLKDET